MKKYLIILFLLLSVIVRAQQIEGTQITSPVVPNDIRDDYPTHIDSLGFGGYRVVTDITQRDGIKPSRRVKGMLVYVQSDSTMYQLGDGDAWNAVPLTLADIDTIPNTLNVQGALNVVGNPPNYYPEAMFSVQDSATNQRMMLTQNGVFMAGRLHTGPIDSDGLYIIGADNYLGGINSSSSGYNVYNNSDSTQAFGTFLHTGDKNNAVLIGTGKSESQPLVLDRDNSVQIGANTTSANLVLTEDTNRLYGLTLFNDSTLPELIAEHGGGGGISSGEFSSDIEIISYNDATYRIVSDVPIYDNERVLEVNDTSVFMGAISQSKGSDVPASSYINIHAHSPGTFSSQEGDDKGILFYDFRAADKGSGPEEVTTQAVFNWQGFKYTNFDENDWTDSSLVTKKYVDDNSAGGTETDPVYTASQAANITATDITNLSNLSGTNTGDQDLSSLATQSALEDTASALRTYVDNSSGGSSSSGTTGAIQLSDGSGGFTSNSIFYFNGTRLDFNKGTGNYFIGDNAGGFLSNGTYNIFFGESSGIYISSGDYNTSVGYSSGGAINTGSHNTLFGSLAGFSIQSGSDNTLIGSEAGRSFSTATGNTVIGRSAGNGATGNNNTYIGEGAGKYSSSGQHNVYIGSGAGLNASGSDNILIGYQAGYSATGSNKLYIENSNGETPLIGGDFSADEVTINGSLEVTEGIKGVMQVAKAEVLYSNGSQTTIVTIPASAVIWNIALELVTPFNDSGTDYIDIGTTTTADEYVADQDVYNSGSTTFLASGLSASIPDRVTATTNITFTYAGQNSDASQGQAFIYVHYTLH